MLSNVLVCPADGPGDVADDRPHIDFRQEPVVGGDEDKPLGSEELRLELDVLFIAGLPAAAMDPEDDREALCVWRGVDVEHLPLLRRVSVGDVALAVLSP